MNIKISLPYFPAPGTGTGEAVYGFAKGLILTGANVTVLAEGNSYLKSHFREVPYIKFTRKQSRNPFSISKDIEKYIQKNKEDIDLFILNGIYVPYMYTLAMFLKKNQIPYVHIPHGLYTKNAMGNSPLKKRIYIKLFEKKILESAEAVQIFTPDQIQTIKKIANPRNFIISPNGIDSNRFIGIESNLKKRNQIKRIIFFGRKDVYTKGLDLLVSAMKKVSNLKVHLFIVGEDTKDTELLRKQIKKDNIKNVFLKKKYTGNVVEYLQKYDFMIIPSRHDAFPMSVLDAMIAEIPVIVSSEVGSAVHVKKAGAGLVCEVTQNSIASHIEKLLKMEDQWEQMGKNGKEYAIKILNWKSICEDTLQQYKDIYV